VTVLFEHDISPQAHAAQHPLCDEAKPQEPLDPKNSQEKTLNPEPSTPNPKPKTRLRAAFTFQDMYIGVSPYDAPATFSLLQYTEFCDGVWYCKGGMCRIADQLAVAAAGSGATILYERSVKEICVEGGVAKGVRLDDGSRLDADVVGSLPLYVVWP
jgi:hypothetical protein